MHLAGDNIASGRWTAAKKASIRNSRVQGTTVLCEALTQLVKPPKVLLCASAIGYYGDRGETTLREESPPGTGFLAEVCQAWEAATTPAVQRGIRVVHLRFGMVLSPAGGTRQDAHPLSARSRWGRGHGQAVHELDCPGRCPRSYPPRPEHRDLARPGQRRGAASGDQPKFTTLGKVLRRPTRLPLPAFAARLLFGEMADALLLASTRVRRHGWWRLGILFTIPSWRKRSSTCWGYPRPRQAEDPAHAFVSCRPGGGLTWQRHSVV